MKPTRRTEGAAPTGPPAPARPAVPLGWGGWLLVGLAAAYVVTYLVVALARLPFPFELEWMEGSSIAQLDRLARGAPLYVKPSLEFTPFIYPPFYFAVSAWVATLTGVGFLPLRLVSLAASLGCFALLYMIVRPGSASPAPAALAAGLFAACYRQGGAWLDIGRVDSLFLLLLLASFLALRRIDSPWIGGVVAGGLITLSALTKQAALLVAAPLALAAVATDLRRGLSFAAGTAVLLGTAVALLDRQTGGWFRFYVFELPRHHPIIGQLLRGFWIDDLLGPVGIGLLIGACHFFATPVRARRRELALDGAFVLGLIATAYLTRIRVGSYVNVVLPAYLGVALLFGLGLNALLARRASDRPGGRLAERYVVLLCVAQFALLAYKPWRQIPRARDRVAGEQIVESLRRVQGDLWVPRHPYLAAMAGKPWRAHELALQDVLRRTDAPPQHALAEALNQAARQRRFAVLVLDDETWVHDAFAPYYTLQARMFRDDESDLFFPATGYWTRPGFVWMPSADSIPARAGS